MGLLGITWLIFWFYLSFWLSLAFAILLIGWIGKAIISSKLDKLKKNGGFDDDGHTA